MLRLLRDSSDAFSDVCKRERWLIPKSKGRASDKTSVQRDTLDTSRAGQSLCRVICRDKIDKIAFQLVNRNVNGGWVGKRSSAGRREGKARGGKKYWKRKARQKLLAQCEHHTFRRPSHCILFLFCANNRWALSLFLSHEWSMPVRSGIVRTPSIYESSHSSPVTMLVFFFLSLFSPLLSTSFSFFSLSSRQTH